MNAMPNVINPNSVSWAQPPRSPDASGARPELGAGMTLLPSSEPAAVGGVVSGAPCAAAVDGPASSTSPTTPATTASTAMPATAAAVV